MISPVHRSLRAAARYWHGRIAQQMGQNPVMEGKHTGAGLWGLSQAGDKHSRGGGSGVLWIPFAAVGDEMLNNSNVIILCRCASVTLLALPGSGDACLTQGQDDGGQVSVPLCRHPAAASGKENSVSF